jgi:hypothetical protein
MLLAKAQFLDDILVAVKIHSPQIVEQPSPLTNEFQKPPAGMVILLMDLKMICEIVDPVAEDGHLNFRRPGVALMKLETIDNVFFCVSLQNHFGYLLCFQLRVRTGEEPRASARGFFYRKSHLTQGPSAKPPWPFILALPGRA